MNQTTVSIPHYIATFPAPTQQKLTQLYQLIPQLIPEAEETFRYGIPTFRINNKNVVHFAGYKYHLGFYPGAEAIVIFQDQLKDFKVSKGTIQLPLDKPLPTDIITKIIQFRLRGTKQ